MSASIGQAGSAPAGQTVTLTGVNSGDPLLFFSEGSLSVPSDTFPTPYTWTNLYSLDYATFWIGTGGAGTSGTISSGGHQLCVVSVVNAIAGSGSAILDPGWSSSNTDTV